MKGMGRQRCNQGSVALVGFRQIWARGPPAGLESRRRVDRQGAPLWVSMHNEHRHAPFIAASFVPVSVQGMGPCWRTAPSPSLHWARQAGGEERPSAAESAGGAPPRHSASQPVATGAVWAVPSAAPRQGPEARPDPASGPGPLPIPKAASYVKVQGFHTCPSGGGGSTGHDPAAPLALAGGPSPPARRQPRADRSAHQRAGTADSLLTRELSASRSLPLPPRELALTWAADDERPAGATHPRSSSRPTGDAWPPAAADPGPSPGSGDALPPFLARAEWEGLEWAPSAGVPAQFSPMPSPPSRPGTPVPGVQLDQLSAVWPIFRHGTFRQAWAAAAADGLC